MESKSSQLTDKLVEENANFKRELIEIKKKVADIEKKQKLNDVKTLIDSLLKVYQHNTGDPVKFMNILQIDQQFVMFSQRTEAIMLNRRLETVVPILKKIFNEDKITVAECDSVYRFYRAVNPKEVRFINLLEKSLQFYFDENTKLADDYKEYRRNEDIEDQKKRQEYENEIRQHNNKQQAKAKVQQQTNTNIQQYTYHEPPAYHSTGKRCIIL